MKNLSSKWVYAWSDNSFKMKLSFGLLLNILTLIFLSHFFSYIERRQGTQLHDAVLQVLPAYDISIELVLFTWGGLLFWMIKSLFQPDIILTFTFSYLILTIFRITTISVIPLNPPKSLIILVDPLSDLLYSGQFKTKDLFFSGHVSTSFLMALCLPNKSERKVLYVITILIGLGVLVQHVHYTIDVLAAPIFAYFSYHLAKKLK